MLRQTTYLGLFALLVASALSADDSPRQGDKTDTSPSNPPYRDQATGLTFSDITGFQRRKVHKYEQDGLGFDVTYNSPNGARVTIYVYDFGLPNIPDGADSDIVKAQIARAKNDINLAKDRGLYQAVRELADGVVKIGEENATATIRKMSFQIRRDDVEHVSDLYLTGYKKHFLKLRVTYPASEKAKCEMEVASVLASLAKMMQGESSKE